MTLKSLIRILKIISIREKKRFIKFGTNYFVIAGTFDKNYNLIAYGVNSYIKTHPYQKLLAIKNGNEHKIFLHAEIDALVKTKIDAFGIVVLRLDSKGNFCISKPCMICSMAIKKSGIKKIVYFDKEFIVVKTLD